MADLAVGERVGRYQLVAPIGVGGMGKVWVALDDASPGLRLVALKTSLSGADGGMNPDFWAVLADEAALASRIAHPNVCATHELGHEGGVHFLVMDWSDGASLRDLLNGAPNKRLTPELAAFVCASLAGGLHAAHELVDEEGHALGVVHRDVSPQNVLISTRGQVRLADFGVAKSRGQLHKATETGEVKGKLSYMAPEQVTSRNIDRRADIFALGCVLYEATLGERPFHGADALATMYQILEADLVPPRERDPAFPAALERVLLKALEKDPARRYQTAEELREELIEYLSSAGRVIADRHVAEVLSGALGSQLAERNRSIIEAAERLRRGEPAEALQAPPAALPHETLTPDGGVERSVTALHRGRQQAWRAGVVTGVGLLAAAAVWWVQARSTEAQLPRPAGSHVAASSAASVSPPTPEASIAAPTSSPPPPPPPPVTATPEPPAALSATTPRTPPPRVSVKGAATPTSAPPAKPPGRVPRPIDRHNPFE